MNPYLREWFFPSRTQKEMIDRQRAQLAHSGSMQVPPMSNAMSAGGPMGGGFRPDNQQVCWNAPVSVHQRWHP